METLEALEKRIATTEDLRAIVRTMKSLSAVSIHQYEQAVTALRDYGRTLELGLQVLLHRERPQLPEPAPRDAETLAVVFGSDHGLCGRFNLEIARFVGEDLGRDGAAAPRYLVAGARVAAQLEAEGAELERSFLLPGSVSGLTELAYRLLGEIDALRARHPIGRVRLFYMRRAESGRATPRGRQLLPLDPRWLRALAQRPWPGPTLPSFTMQPPALFAALVRQHLFIGLFRAAAESAASEHATRLAAMQAAERNIESHLSETQALYRRRRQQAITEELLDVVAGFEALSPPQGPQ